MPKRIKRSLRRARDAAATRARTGRGRLATVTVCVLAGFMITASALAAREGDLRPNRSTDLVELVRSQAARNQGLAADLSTLRGEVDELAASAGAGASHEGDISTAAQHANLSAVRGPGVRVTLTDAPLEVKPPGVAGDLLVVHQQDIQAVVNALWAGGAEAMTIQGVRVISSTGIKCVGNSVVLKGVPYAPPYVITAVGNQARLEAALDSSPAVRIYKQYVGVYQLGYAQSRVADAQLPAYIGSIDLAHAQPVS